MAEQDLLVTKFTIPPVRADVLPRAPLIERLNQCCALPLALLSAGAGFGKTTLLAAWASQLPRPVAWLSLDPLDNDPLRFWSAILAALRALRTCRARLQLDLGDLSAVEHWSRTRADGFEPMADGPQRERELPYVQQEEEALLVIRLALARGQAQAALQQLAPWKAQAEAQGRTHAVLEMQILEALAHWADQAIPQAQAALLQALRLAHPERYQRLFLDEGKAMAFLLKSSLNAIPEHEVAVYARHLRDALERERAGTPGIQPSSPSPLAEPLTPQERRVLQLVADGLSNQQIATQLVISLATAKKHVTNLLGKLGAANRTQALVQAREYDLLKCLLSVDPTRDCIRANASRVIVSCLRPHDPCVYHLRLPVGPPPPSATYASKVSFSLLRPAQSTRYRCHAGSDERHELDWSEDRHGHAMSHPHQGPSRPLLAGVVRGARDGARGRGHLDALWFTQGPGGTAWLPGQDARPRAGRARAGDPRRYLGGLLGGGT